MTIAARTSHIITSLFLADLYLNFKKSNRKLYEPQDAEVQQQIAMAIDS